LVNPSEHTINSSIFSTHSFSKFEPKPGGTYRISITNLGKEPTQVSGLLGYLPFIKGNGQLSPNVFSEIFNGSVIFVVGLSVLVFGIFVSIFSTMKDNWSIERLGNQQNVCLARSNRVSVTSYKNIVLLAGAP
jgi:hypothetical protein